MRQCGNGVDPVGLVRAGTADAALLDLPLAEHTVGAAGAGRDLEIAGPRIGDGPYGIAIRIGDRELSGALQSALQAVIADGTYVGSWRSGA